MDKLADIFVFDDIHPEDNAMLQALYSRSPASVVSHLEKVKASGSGKFMESYYVGYGHASIGDCGSTTVFIENVTKLVAKAIQDNPLYSGQEASTRYLDFSQQPLYDPYNHPASRAILQKGMDIYNSTLPKVMAALEARYPFDPVTDKKEGAWRKAIQVRAFDICRGLLPIATTTLLSWHTNLRQARDHLRYLSSHPLAEVRNVALRIFNQLREKYPNSFNGEEMAADSARYAERNIFANAIAADTHFLPPESALARLTPARQDTVRSGGMVFDDRLYDAEGINALLAAMPPRPKGGILPRHLSGYGMCRMAFLLDFGSHHDIHRHRNGVAQMPLTTAMFGFHHWYKNELQAMLPAADFAALMDALDAQNQAILDLPKAGVETDALRSQYLYPMGTACLLEVAYTLPQLVYVSELRSSKTVHPSLRLIAQAMGRETQKRHPSLKLYVDYDEDSWTVKRGEQDIVEKQKAG